MKGRRTIEADPETHSPTPVDAPAQRSSVSKAGDLDQFCRDNLDYVWRCLRHLGVPVSDLPDATQDVLLAATNNFDKYEGRASIRTWLFGFAKYVSMSYGRSSFREQRKREALQHARASEPPLDPMSSHEDEAHAIAVLKSLLTQLDEDKRHIYILAVVEEVPIVKIATEIGVNVNTLHTRLHMARKQVHAAAAIYHANEKANR